MGWKTDLIVMDRELDESTILAALGRAGHKRAEMLTGEDLFPPKDFMMCTHKGCTIVGDPDLAGELASEFEDASVLSTLSSLGSTRVMACVLHSVVNLAAFSLFQDGRLVRAYASSSGDGVFIDEGEMLNCEKKVYSNYESKTLDNGSMVFVDEHDEYDQSALGEDVVFELLATFLGQRPDMDDSLFETEVHTYAAPPKGILARLIGG